MAARVRAGINKRYVVAATGRGRGERIERAILGCAVRRATELARSLPLSAFAERGTGGEDSARRRGGRGVTPQCGEGVGGRGWVPMYHLLVLLLDFLVMT